MTLHRADGPLGVAWWVLVVVRAVLPRAVRGGDRCGRRRRAVGRRPDGRPGRMGVVFVLLQVVAPLHQAVGENLGNRLSAWLYDRLTEACAGPPGIGHLEDPGLSGDLVVAREFDNGVAGPPMEVSLPFIAVGLVDLGAGLASAVVLVGLAWWAPLVLGGRLAGDALAAGRERGVARPQHRRGARRQQARRLRLPDGRRPTAGQGAADVRPRRLGRRPLHGSTSAALRAPERRDPAARAAGRALPAPGHLGQRRGLRVPRPTRRRRATCPWTGRSCSRRWRSAPA